MPDRACEGGRDSQSYARHDTARTRQATCTGMPPAAITVTASNLQLAAPPLGAAPSRGASRAAQSLTPGDVALGRSQFGLLTTGQAGYQAAVDGSCRRQAEIDWSLISSPGDVGHRSARLDQVQGGSRRPQPGSGRLVSGGRQVIDVAELASPRQAGWFSPTPLARSSDQVVVWSFPIVSQCLVDVVDIASG